VSAHPSVNLPNRDCRLEPKTGPQVKTKGHVCLCIGRVLRNNSGHGTGNAARQTFRDARSFAYADGPAIAKTASPARSPANPGSVSGQQKASGAQAGHGFKVSHISIPPELQIQQFGSVPKDYIPISTRISADLPVLRSSSFFSLPSAAACTWRIRSLDRPSSSPMEPSVRGSSISRRWFTM